MRLIDADKIQNAIGLYLAENAYLNETALDAYKNVSKWLTEVPTIEAEPVKHGYDTGKCRIFHCSVCGYGFNDIFLDNESDYPIDPNYCPNCGAKMDMEGDA